jgi:hypothetical protein
VGKRGISNNYQLWRKAAGMHEMKAMGQCCGWLLSVMSDVPDHQLYKMPLNECITEPTAGKESILRSVRSYKETVQQHDLRMIIMSGHALHSASST